MASIVRLADHGVALLLLLVKSTANNHGVNASNKTDGDKNVTADFRNQKSDDNVTVLQSARNFGVDMLLHITRPDTRRPAREHEDFVGIEGVGDLVQSD